MDVLKREMERKRMALQEAKQQRQKTGGGTSRFVKASELRRLMEEVAADHEQQASLKRECDASDAAAEADGDADREKSTESAMATTTTTIMEPNDKQDDNGAAKVAHQSQSQSMLINKRRKMDHETHVTIASRNVVSTAQQEHGPTNSIESITQALRSLGLPIALFGETFQDRVGRLEAAVRNKAVVQLQETEADEFRLGHGHGIRNPFLEKEWDESVMKGDPHYHHNHRAAATAESDLVPQLGSNEYNHKSKREKEVQPDNTAGNDDDDASDPHKRVYRHFKGLLKQWEADLNERSDEVKRSLAGRNETKKVKQCKDYIRPLFQLCKRRQLEDNLLHKLDQMVQYCQEGEFVRAHDAYLDVAIGRAAWPIGVTMVGIHARTGRAKIESANVAHVMNSELQRKYLTSVKRLVTYEQTKRTDVDPSKKVR